jgi:hypothetical protein
VLGFTNVDVPDHTGPSAGTCPESDREDDREDDRESDREDDRESDREDDREENREDDSDQQPYHNTSFGPIGPKDPTTLQ